MADDLENSGQDDEQDSLEDVSAATEIGWRPKDKMRDPDKFISAKEYLEKGQVVLPILRKRNQDLMTDIQALRQRDTEREGELKSIRAALKAVEESQDADLADRIKATKEGLEEEIAKASEEGDHKRLAKLTVDLTDLVAAERVKAATPPKVDSKGEDNKQPPLSPEYISWQGENEDWLGIDREKTDIAVGIGHTLAREGLKGPAFFKELDKRLDKYFGKAAQQRGPGKVEEGGNGGDGGGGGEDVVKGYSDLPKDARETCDRLARKMVGEGKPHKDLKTWRASYTKQYLAQG